MDGEYDVETSLHVMEQEISSKMPLSPSRYQGRLTITTIDEEDKQDATDGGLVSKYFGSYEKHSRTGIKSANKSPISKWGWLFLLLALIQALMIIGLQIVIAVLGDFDEGQLQEYVECALNMSNVSLENTTYPSFGADKQIYVYIFVFLIFYNFLLCVYAIFAQRIVEVFAFLIINVLIIGYAALQVYQFRGFGGTCDLITTVGWLALVNVGVVIIFNLIFAFLVVQIYVEFGWKVYKFVNCNPALRYYYRMYEIFLSVVKMVSVFTITFLVGQLALILRRLDDPEFWLTFPYIIGMLCLFFYAYFMVRRESHIAILVMFVIGILLFCYYVFKIVRYTTRSCPICMEIDEEIRMQGFIFENDDRREDFRQLTMIASLNMIIVIVYLICVVRVWRQYGKGLADHFYIHGHWFDRIGKRKPSENSYLNSIGTVGTGTLAKPKKSSSRSKRSFLENANRHSSLDEAECNQGVVFTPMEMAEFHLNSPISRTASSPPILDCILEDKK